MDYTSDRVFTGTRTLSHTASKSHRMRLLRALSQREGLGDIRGEGIGGIEGTRT